MEKNSKKYDKKNIINWDKTLEELENRTKMEKQIIRWYNLGGKMIKGIIIETLLDKKYFDDGNEISLVQRKGKYATPWTKYMICETNNEEPTFESRDLQEAKLYFNKLTDERRQNQINVQCNEELQELHDFISWQEPKEYEYNDKVNLKAMCLSLLRILQSKGDINANLLFVIGKAIRDSGEYKI